MVQEKLRRAGLLLQAVSELRGNFDADDQDTQRRGGERAHQPVTRSTLRESNGLTIKPARTLARAPSSGYVRKMGAIMFRRASWAFLVGITLATSALAQDASTDDVDCKPACRLGFECVKGACVAEQCKPACRSGFVCVEGECKSACNPPCASNERCTDKADCVRLAPVHVETSDDETGAATPPVVHAKTESKDKYKAAGGRVYGGLAIFALGNALGPGIITTFGGSLALDGHIGEENLFYVGGRIMVVGSAGVIALLDVDFGLRGHVEVGPNSAVIFTLGSGLGGGFASSSIGTTGFFHLPLRLGIGVDVNAFTAEALAGPALIAGNGALGVFESMIQVGIRW